MLPAIVNFLLVLSLLVLLHELGRLLAARMLGLEVLRFAIGLGPPTPLSFRHRRTVYLLCWLPFGGHMTLADSEGKPVAARMLVTSAGVLVNLLFAWSTYSGLALVYGRPEEPTTTLWRVDAARLPEAAAALADVPRGAQVLRVNGQDVTTWNSILTAVTDSRSDHLRLDFAAADPIVVDVPGAHTGARAAIASALVPFREARIGFLAPGEPAMEAGLLPGDVVVAIDGGAIGAWDDLALTVEASAGEALVLSIERAGQRLEVPMTASEGTSRDPLSGELRTVGRIGIGPRIDTVRIRPGFQQAWIGGAERTWESTSRLLSVLQAIVAGAIRPAGLSGPTAVAPSFADERSGLAVRLSSMAFLSVSIAVLNLLPIPPLAGAGLCFLLYEAMLGKPLPRGLRRRLDLIGRSTIVGLIVLGTLGGLLL